MKTVIEVRDTAEWIILCRETKSSWEEQPIWLVLVICWHVRIIYHILMLMIIVS